MPSGAIDARSKHRDEESELESDAVKYQTVLPKRLARFSLSVAEDKTKLIRFGRFARRDCQRRTEGASQTFDFLGFTHYCGTSREGRFKLQRKTSTKKLRMKLLDLNRWFWKQLETPIGEMWHTLNAKLRGHYQYYGIHDNWPLLMAYRDHARRLAKRHISCRSQNSYFSWAKFNAFLEENPLASPLFSREQLGPEGIHSRGGPIVQVFLTFPRTTRSNSRFPATSVIIPMNTAGRLKLGGAIGRQSAKG